MHDVESSESEICSQNLFPQTPRVIAGLPDIFSTPVAINRSSRSNKQNSKILMAVLHTDPVDYICRICHGGSSSGDLLTPCRCKGTIALAHLKCLETWLSESNRNQCELCNYTYRVIREPKFSILWSIVMFLRHPGEYWKELLVDFVTFIIYTPSTITSTYMLMLLCENVARSQMRFQSVLMTHVMIFTSIFGISTGIATINFTYTSWLAMVVEKYFECWQDYYKKNCELRILLSRTHIKSIDTIVESVSQSQTSSFVEAFEPVENVEPRAAEV